jgi:hypothetical protein
VSGQTLTVASRHSSTVDIKMADSFTVIGVVKAALSDIKPGAFVGAAALPEPDGSFRAQEVLIFFPSRPATGLCCSPAPTSSSPRSSRATAP